MESAIRIKTEPSSACEHHPYYVVKTVREYRTRCAECESMMAANPHVTVVCDCIVIRTRETMYECNSCRNKVKSCWTAACDNFTDMTKKFCVECTEANNRIDPKHEIDILCPCGKVAISVGDRYSQRVDSIVRCVDCKPTEGNYQFMKGVGWIPTTVATRRTSMARASTPAPEPVLRESTADPALIIRCEKCGVGYHERKPGDPIDPFVINQCRDCQIENKWLMCIFVPTGWRIYRHYARSGGTHAWKVPFDGITKHYKCCDNCDPGRKNGGTFAMPYPRRLLEYANGGEIYTARPREFRRRHK